MAQHDTSHSSKKVHSILLPLVTKSIETNWSFGLASISTFKISKKDTVSRTSNVEAIAIYSLKKQFVAVINGNQYFKNEKLILTEQISYSSFPDKFWGIGNKTPSKAEESYSFQQYFIYAHLMRNLGNKLFIGGLAEFQNVMQLKYQQGGLFDKDNVAGRNGYRSAGLGVSLTYDKRNHAFAPNKGTFAQVFFTEYNQLFGSSYSFSTLVVDIRKYLPIGKTQVLALQTYSLNNIGNEIPIRNLASLGGANSMRGYYNGRFRDHDLLVFQSEYRMHIWKRFGLAAFAGLGSVANNVNEYSFKNIKYSFGGGLRFALNKSERLNLRIDYGIGSNNNKGLYFQIGEAF
jgi:outer membrane protein assembly factor BamA